MNKLYSFAILLAIPFCVNFCTDLSIDENQTPPGKITILVKTIDSYGKPIPAELIYEQQDCEYDFNSPGSIKTNKKGFTFLPIDPGYLQVYVKGFLHESYLCGNYQSSDTLVLYAAPIPTYVKVLDSSGAPVADEPVYYFPNSSGNCDFEANPEAIKILTNKKGIATLFLPNDTYKIEVGTEVQCFQPSQMVETLVFTKKG